MAHKIAVIGGDGIGPEVTAEAIKVMEAAGVELETTDFDLGGARYLRDGEVLSDTTLEELRAFDAILLDAPCSATGGIRRHPDIKLLRRPSDVDRLAREQRALLDAWQNLPRLKDPDRFEAWVYRLLVNACNAEARRERRHRGNLRLLASDEPVVPDAATRIAIQHQLDHAFRRLGVEGGLL